MACRSRYAFAATTAWADHEGMQADIFGHLIAITPEFGLRLFQRPSDLDPTALRPAAAMYPGRP